jgi:ADP-ribose pyrophosphatase
MDRAAVQLVDLFLYGTLLHDPLFHLVAGPGEGARKIAAVLPDHLVERMAGSTLPFLANRVGQACSGIIYPRLTAAQQRRIHNYEAAFGHELRDVMVILGGGVVSPAQAWFPPQTEESAGEPWSIATWRATDAEVTCLAAVEVLAHDPPLSPPELFRQWPMIAGRAEAALRGRASDVPAVQRYRPGPADHALVNAAPLAGGFFKLATLDVTHRRFDGALQGPRRREVLVGVDAALVLPYDRARDRVLLVEQFRVGIARRQDANPWCLEPVAGIVDADETPEAAGLREAEEEAGLQGVTLQRMFSIYPSPGSSTDHFYCYLGLTDLPDLGSYAGGLAEEAEDLRLHVLGYEEAMGLVDTGEINAGPLVAMLLWLGRERGLAQG